MTAQSATRRSENNPERGTERADRPVRLDFGRLGSRPNREEPVDPRQFVDRAREALRVLEQLIGHRERRGEQGVLEQVNRIGVEEDALTVEEDGRLASDGDEVVRGLPLAL